MNGWHGRRLCALSLVGWGLLASGCQAGTPVARPSGSADFPALLQMAGADTAVSRGQKPDAKPNPLNFRPDDFGSSETRTARIRAVVNDTAILDEEVLAAAYQGLLGAKTEVEKAEILNAKLNEIIDREVVLQDAELRLGNKGGGKFIKELKSVATDQFNKQWLYKLMNANKMTDEKVFRDFCAANGMSVDLIQRQWERSFIAMEYLRGRIQPTVDKISQRDVSEYYDRHPDEFKVEESVEWQDLFIAASRFPSREEARAFAESLVARLKAGQDFMALSKQFDHGDSSLRENSLGIGTKRGEVKPPEAEPAVFSLRAGQVGPLVEMETGFHVVKMLKRTDAGRRPFDDKLQKTIKDKLRGDVFSREMKRTVGDLRRKALIQVAETLK
ncbi:MAG: peptidylprolyl isomerase [Gemmataceae bacterium]